MIANSATLPRIIGATVALALLTGTPAFAQDSETGTDYLEALRACSTIMADDERLACFDSAVTEVIALRDSGEIQVVDKEDIRETRRGLFGFSLPKLGVFGDSDDEADTVLQSTITNLRQIRSDLWEIEIAEGSVWQVSNAPRRFKPRVGGEVELEKAAMSSYWLRADGQLGVKARRIR